MPCELLEIYRIGIASTHVDVCSRIFFGLVITCESHANLCYTHRKHIADNGYCHRVSADRTTSGRAPRHGECENDKCSPSSALLLGLHLPLASSCLRRKSFRKASNRTEVKIGSTQLSIPQFKFSRRDLQDRQGCKNTFFYDLGICVCGNFTLVLWNWNPTLEPNWWNWNQPYQKPERTEPNRSRSSP